MNKNITIYYKSVLVLLFVVLSPLSNQAFAQNKKTLLADTTSIQAKNSKQEIRGATKIDFNKVPKTKIDTTKIDLNTKTFVPDSGKATWLALVFPGGGQIYNRKYWKLPIIYGGFAGCAYALSWNSKMYKDYSQAYLDVMDDNPNTNSHLELLPPNYNYSEEQLKEVLRKRKDLYRRYRDISVFAFIGVYLLSVVDAYVDAELSNFDISPDLSMKIEPAVINSQIQTSSKSYGIQCSLRF